MKAKFRKVEYRIRCSKLIDAWGKANDPSDKNRSLRFDQELFKDSPRLKRRKRRGRVSKNSRNLLETLIHEALHACLWDLDEEAVNATGRDIAKFLKRCGINVDPKKVREAITRE